MINQVITIIVSVILLVSNIVYYSTKLSENSSVIDTLKSKKTDFEQRLTQSTSKQTELENKLKIELDSIDQLRKELKTATNKLSDSNRELVMSQEELLTAKQKAEQLKEILSETDSKVIEKLKSQLSDSSSLSITTQINLVKQLKNEIGNQEIKIQDMGGKLKLSLSNKILFASAQTTLMDEGLAVLERLGYILKGLDNNIIRVEGHTDNVKIRYRLKEKYPTNWELSASRATNVVRFLIDKVGINPKKIYAVGMSKYHPIGDNSTPSGRGMNRRIEIMLEPVVDVKEVRELQLVDENSQENLNTTDIENNIVTTPKSSDEFSNLDEPKLIMENEPKLENVKRFTVSNKMITTEHKNSATLNKPVSYTTGRSKSGVGYIWVKKQITDFPSE